MDYSYEEIRNIALDILAGREHAQYEPTQYAHLEADIGEVLRRRSGRTDASHSYLGEQELSYNDGLLFQEVFWDLFRQGVITLGMDRANQNFPFFRVSSYGHRILDNQNAYFFYDVASYEKIIRESIPDIDETTLLYLKEAMQAFHAGCILSASVMLGVATEHAFLSLLEFIESHPTAKAAFKAALSERMILRKYNAFRKTLETQLGTMPTEIKEGIDTQLSGILDIIRTFRNESGHPSGKIISREQCYVLLNLYVPYCKKIYQLMKHFRVSSQ
jgi:hypothetical protein